LPSGSYRKVMRSPGVASLLATSLVARLPVAMVNLAIILRVVHATGSYARAGEIAACYVVGTGIGSPLLSSAGWLSASGDDRCSF
jgi:hypothetical protein